MAIIALFLLQAGKVLAGPDDVEPLGAGANF